MRPHTPEELSVVLAADTGRPYELQLGDSWEQLELVRTEIGTLVTDAGDVHVIDGNLLELGVHDSPHPVVSFEQHELQVAELVLHQDGRPRWWAGVVIEDPHRSVVRWAEFELAFGTDGGAGGVFADAVVPHMEQWEADGRPSDLFVHTYDSPEPWIDQHATTSGFDSYVFSTGGDGAFPMARGYAPDGSLAAVVIWGELYPWRLAFPGIEPPPDVIDREAELLECLQGRRGVTEGGTCSYD